MSLSLLPTNSVLINQVAVTVFGAAPGATILNNYLEYAETNGIDATLNLLLTVPGLGSDANFNLIVLGNFGLASDPVSVAYMESSVAANGRLATMKEVFTFFGSVAGSDNIYGTAGTAFNQKVTKSIEYSSVATNTSFSVDAVSAAAISTGSTFTLTNSANQSTGGADNLTGTSGNDTFLAVADAALGNGDVVDGGAGVDTLTARYAVAADTTINTSLTNVENFVIDTDEGDALNAHELNIAVAFTGLEEVRIKDAVATDAVGVDDINVTSIALGVDVAIENGDGVFDVDFVYASVTGTSDVATLNVASSDVETVTIAGIETLTINGESGDSDIATLTTTAATTVNVTGAGNVDVNNIDDATVTINASTATGDVEIRGIGAVDSVITGGAGDDVFDFAGNLTADDTVAGGDGTDRVVVSGSETAALASVTSIEEVEIDTDDIDDATTVTISGAAVTSATKFVARANTATDNDDATLAFTNLDSGDTIEFLTGGADTTTLTDGVAITTAFTTNTIADALTLEFDGIGAVSASAANDTGLANVEVDEVEILTIVSNANSTGTVTVNAIEQLDIATATSVTFTGAADFTTDATTDGVVNTTALTTVDATGLTGDLTLFGVDASALTLTDGAGDLALTLAGLNNEDTIDGGDQDTSTGDAVTATSVTGLTATTGALNVSNVENLNIQATGANTFDLTNVTNVAVFALSGATPGTQTLTGVASGQVIGIGEAGAVFDSGAEIDVTLADATGSADTLTFNVNNTANANTDATLDISGVETITLDVAAAANNAQVLVANAEATTLNVVDGGAAALLTLGTLNAGTSTVDASGFDGDISFSGANATSAMTVLLAGLATADDATLSGENDTLTVAETAGGVAMDLDGGAGTDTINVTLANGVADFDEVDNFEVMNLTVVSGADVTAGANADEVEGIDELTTLNVLGGNSLSTLTIGVLGTDVIDVQTIQTIDASEFQGNIVLTFGAEDFTSATTVTGSALTTDRIIATYNTAATIDANTVGVETVDVQIDTGNVGTETYRFDIADMSGLTTLGIENVTATNIVHVDNYVDTATVALGYDAAGNATRNANEDFRGQININHDAALGAGDIVNVELFDTNNGGTTVDLNAAGIETLNLIVDNTATAETHSIDLAGVTASTDESVTVNISGDGSDNVTITTASSTVDVINGSAMAGALTISDRDSSAMTITGGSGADNLRMEHGSDVMTGGSGTDTLTIVQNAVLGGFQIDLSSTTDQVTTYNGSANSAVQVGFESVDLSGITGSFGADITAHDDGSVITGTVNVDQITLGDGDDDVVFTSLSSSDTVTGFTTTSDDLNVSGLGTLVGDIPVDTAAAGAAIALAAAEALIVTDATNASFGDVVTILNEAIDTAGVVTGDTVLIVNNGTDSRVYLYQDDTAAAAIAAGELTLVGTISGVPALAEADIIA